MESHVNRFFSILLAESGYIEEMLYGKVCTIEDRSSLLRIQECSSLSSFLTADVCIGDLIDSGYAFFNQDTMILQSVSFP